MLRIGIFVSARSSRTKYLLDPPFHNILECLRELFRVMTDIITNGIHEVSFDDFVFFSYEQ